MSWLKRMWQSKLFRLGISGLLLFLAFRKVDILKLGREIMSVPWWLTVGLLLYLGVTMFLGGWRWSLLALDKVGLGDVWQFTKATYVGGFYSLFFPTAVAGDLLKWTSLLKKYPKIHKIKLAGTALIDRVIGFTAFSIVALVALLLGRSRGYNYPGYLLWLFLWICGGIVAFYVLAFNLDLPKILGKIRILARLGEVAELLKKGNKGKILGCLGLCLVSEPVWIMCTWFIARIFGLALAPLEVFIFMPVIALVLVLPISMAGFGAREQLFLYFFGQLGLSPERILLVSAFNGVLGVLNSLIGGFLLWL